MGRWQSLDTFYGVLSAARPLCGGYRPVDATQLGLVVERLSRSREVNGSEPSDSLLSRSRLGIGPMRVVALLCLVAIAVDAVLIQTVVTDESSPLKDLMRIGVLAVASSAVLVDGSLVPRWMVGVIILSTILMLLRGNSDQLSYVFVFVLVPLLWSIPERRTEHALMISSGVALVLIFAFLAVGVTSNVVLDYRSRATYGTQGVPFFYNVVYGAAAMATLYAFKYHLRSRFLTLAICLSFSTYLYWQTDARGGYFSYLAFVALLWLVPSFGRWALFRVVSASLPMLFLAFSFVLAGLAIYPDIDSFFSYRPQLISLFLQNVDWDSYLFSTTVKQFSSFVSAVRTVDNSYLHLLVGGGLIITIIYVGLFMSAMLKLFRTGRYPEVAFLISASIYFNSESILLRIENVFVIYTWYLVLRYSTKLPEERAVPHGGKEGG